MHYKKRKRPPVLRGEDPDRQKRCPRCSKTKGKDVFYPATYRYFYANEGRPDGLSVYCRGCSTASAVLAGTRPSIHIRELSDLAPHEREVPLPHNYRQCANLLCGRVRPLSPAYFRATPAGPDGFSTICRRCERLTSSPEGTISVSDTPESGESGVPVDTERIRSECVGLPGYDETGRPY